MKHEDLIYNIEDGIATLTLNRPQKLNSFTPKMLGGIIELVEEAGRDEKVRVLVITGTGRSFCTGADIRLFEGDPKFSSEPLVRSGAFKLPVLLHRMDKPVIAAINGVTAGGGLDLACACDIRIASEKATFSSIFVRRGLMPTLGSSYFLPRLIGLDKACEFTWTGDIIDAHEAERIGLVTRTVPDDELEPATMELAAKLAKGPPLAIALSKQAIHRGMGMSLEEALDFVKQEIEALRMSEDHKEAISAFMEKREPVFKGK